MSQLFVLVVPGADPRPTQCGKCGRLGHNLSECRVGTNLCYYCGAPGHSSVICPVRCSVVPPLVVTPLQMIPPDRDHVATPSADSRTARSRTFATRTRPISPVAQDDDPEHGYF